MTTIDRNDAGRLSSQLLDTCIRYASRIDRRNSIISLFCFEGAYGLLEDYFLRGLIDPKLREPSVTEEEQLAALDWTIENGVLIQRALDLLLKHSSRVRKEMTSRPSVYVRLSSLDPETLVATLMQEKTLDPQDWFKTTTYYIMNKFQATEIIYAKGTAELEVRNSVNQVYKFLISVRAAGLAEAAAKFGTTVTLEDGNVLPHVNYPSELTPEEKARMGRRTPRTMFDSERAVPIWDSKFKELVTEELLGEGRDEMTSTHGKKPNRDVEEYALSCQSFSGYDSAFRQKYGYSTSSFLSLVSTLLSLSVDQIHGIQEMEMGELVRDTRAKTHLSKSTAIKIIGSLTWHEGVPIETSPIIPVGSKRLFTNNRIASAFFQRLDIVFSQPIYSNEKGKRFEKKCRDLLSSYGFKVYPTPIEITYTSSLDETNLRVLNSDIDVMARKNRFLIVIECKERSAPSSQSKPSELKLAKFSHNLKDKTLWIRNNPQLLSNLVGKEWGEKLLGAGSESYYFLPILVTTTPIRIPDELEPVALSYSELSKLVEAIDGMNPMEQNGQLLLSLQGVVREPSQRAILFETVRA